MSPQPPSTRTRREPPWRRRAGAASLALLLLAMSLPGCTWLGSAPDTRSQQQSLAVDLGDKLALELLWIEPLNILVGKYEVTNLQYRRCKPQHNSGEFKQLDLNQDHQPVANVSWNEARDYCAWLTKSHGIVGGRRCEFRLPTEKEWESFATCGQATEYPWGSTWPPPRNWNYFGRENKQPGQKLENDDGFQVACPVSQSGANAWGLCGVGGNVWEWCVDTDGASQSRVFKGASWSDCHPYFLNVSRRSSNAPDKQFMNRGFRVVADIIDTGVEQQKRLEADQR